MVNEALKNKLAKLKLEHRKLDDDITLMTSQSMYDELALHRLKKRKLQLKDEMRQVESQILPDIIA